MHMNLFVGSFAAWLACAATLASLVGAEPHERLMPPEQRQFAILIGRLRLDDTKSVTVRDKILPDRGFWYVEFEVLHFIQVGARPAGNKEVAVVHVPVHGWHPKMSALGWTGQNHFIVAKWEKGELNALDRRPLRDDDLKALIAREARGMNDVKRLREVRDQSEKLKVYDQIIQRTKTPSMVLALFSRELQGPSTSDAVRARVRQALLPLVLRDDVPIEVRELAGEQLVRWPMGNDEASVAAACEATLKPLMESFQKLAQTPGKEPDREQMILGAMTAVLQYAKPPVGANLPLKEFGQELTKYREAVAKLVSTEPEVIDLNKIPKPGDPVKIEPVKPKELVWKTAKVEQRIATVLASP